MLTTDHIAAWVNSAAAQRQGAGAADDPLARYKAAIAEMVTLKSFLTAYPEVDAGQVVAFLRNTGDTLAGLATHLDRARASGVTVKDYFRSGQKATLKAADQQLTPLQRIARQTCPQLYGKEPRR